VAAAGLGLLVGLGADSGYLQILPALLMWGVGLGILTRSVVAAAMAAVEPQRAGLASAVNNTARQAGGASASRRSVRSRGRHSAPVSSWPACTPVR
jgi:MFS transporter, DHA2 family, methylenomycin A resistance protein